METALVWNVLSMSMESTNNFHGYEQATNIFYVYAEATNIFHGYRLDYKSGSAPTLK
jgi:hypothetical protein